ncbi:MAG: hypothetical protein CW335_03440 [Clostridiales bacterium]|nr:hypothetical protein [Clostridiales bacterium]
MLDHRKKYMYVQGHLVTISFSKQKNEGLYDRIKEILLSAGEADCKPHICRQPSDNHKMRKKEECADGTQ